jgi:hypothetical protein
MMGTKERHVTPLIHVSLEELVPHDLCWLLSLSVPISQRMSPEPAQSTGYATRLQQASDVVRSGLTSHLGHIARLLVTVEKFRWSRRNHESHEER